MKNIIKSIVIGFVVTPLLSFSAMTKRIPQFSNDHVTVWETIIYPGKSKELPMHAHAKGRVLIALTNGTIRFAEANGRSKILKLQKEHAYFLPADNQHTDENIGKQPIKVMIVSLN